MLDRFRVTNIKDIPSFSNADILLTLEARGKQKAFLRITQKQHKELKVEIGKCFNLAIVPLYTDVENLKDLVVVSTS